MTGDGILGRIARHVAQAPASPAVEALRPDGTVRTVTYAELDAMSREVGRQLASAGVGSGAPVIVDMPRVPELIAVLLAVWRAGAHYVPLPDDTSERARRIAASFPAAATVTVGTGVGPQVAPGHPGATGPSPATDDLAYVMFTSGSTGAPKGVAVPLGAMERLVLDETWDDGHHDRLAMVAPHAFQLSTYEIWVPLARGGCVVMAPEGPLDLSILEALVERLQGQSIHLTSGLLRVVALDRPTVLRGLHEVATGGDVVSPSAVAAILDACPGLTVRPIYGCTEGVLFSTSQSYTDASDVDRLALGGRAFAGAHVRVVGPDLTQVPAGDVGEVVIAGERLAVGYVGGDQAAAARFVRSPDLPGGRGYRTGDLGRIDPRGDLVLLGRTDRQVKIRGFRVELNEVERGLGMLPGVRDVAVTAVEPQSGRTRLRAMVAGDVESGRALRRAARSVLPDYMLPDDVVLVERLPLTQRGKVDWRQVAGTAPADDALHRRLCTQFALVLGCGDVEPDDDFFDLGGQSLTAIRLATAIAAETGVDVPARLIFDCPTPRLLGATLETRRVP